MNESTVRTMYDRFSTIPGFWQVDAWISRATAHSPYRAQLIGQLALGATSRVLDVACGTGLNFDLLQQATKGKGSIVGIDNSHKTLKLAHRRVERHGWRNVELVEVSAAAYQAEEPFDAALCTFAIDIIPPWRETIRMMIDAVRPGGRVAFLGFKESTSRPFATFNPLWRAAAAPFGGVELDRPVREQTSTGCDELVYEEVFGGFYYLLVSVRHETPR
jgi:ubiquinone/menaquinone biosynthesis C-methylase UbiE